MDSEKRHFFVIGYPRSRTAWVSVLLNGDGVRCEHEASRGAGADGVSREFESWDAPIMGTCDSALLFEVEALRARYPDAHWVLILRDSDQALAAMMADRPHEAEAWKSRWPAIDAAMDKACQALPNSTLAVPYEQLNQRAWDIYRHCTGKGLPAGKLESLAGLRITQIPTPPPAIPETVRRSAVEQLRGRGISLDGLQVRAFEARKDILLLSRWTEERGVDGGKLAPYLPPLGVVVEDARGPVAMLFCRECYGVPAADLEFSVSRPGLGMKAATAAMGFAVAACIELAGQLVVPRAHYSLFRITCTPAMGRFAQRLGFVPHGAENCQKYIYQKT